MRRAGLKFLVTGATGFIGQEVARQLSDKGCRPRLLVRRPMTGLDIGNLKAEFVKGDLRDPGSLEKAAEGMDAVIHLGARATFEPYADLKPSILEGSQALMRAAASAGVKAFVYSSSLLVYNDSREPVDADTPAAPILDYGRIKLETEQRLASLAAGAGMAFAAIRLPHVYGAEDLYFRQIREGLLILPGLGNNIYTHLHNVDAARLLIACAQRGHSGITPVGDRQPATWTEFLTVVRKHLDGVRVVRLPQWMALLATMALTPFRRFRARPGLERPGAVRSYNFNIAVKPDLLWEDLELTPRFPTIHQGVPAVAQAYKRTAARTGSASSH
jgi:nucleoside-diphosphate-sugar epimerase